jgi:hypothetical protein
MLLAQAPGSRRAGAGSNQKQLVRLTSVFGNAIGDITSLLVRGYDRGRSSGRTNSRRRSSVGYARAALASFLRGVAKENAGGKGGWLATHPSPDDRVAALGELATGSSPGRPVRQQRFAKLLGGG